VCAQIHDKQAIIKAVFVCVLSQRLIEKQEQNKSTASWQLKEGKRRADEGGEGERWGLM
jgi:hypothetical protein